MPCAAWLAELAADGAEALGYLQAPFDGLAAIIVRKAAFETNYPGFVTQWTDETPDWEYFTTAMDLLEEYPEVRASFERFLANEAYKGCVYYDMVRAVHDLLEGNGWAYDYEVREEIDGLLL